MNPRRLSVGFRPIAVITASVAAMMLVMATGVENDVVEAAF